MSGKCSMRFEHLCVPSPDWLVGAFGVRESLDVRPAAPVQAVGKESETGADVNGRGRSSSVAVDPVVMMVAQRGSTQLRAFSCVIVLCIIVISYNLCTLLTFGFNCVL